MLPAALTPAAAGPQATTATASDAAVGGSAAAPLVTVLRPPANKAVGTSAATAADPPPADGGLLVGAAPPTATPEVAQCTSFRGCYQLVFQVAIPAACSQFRQPQEVAGAAGEGFAGLAPGRPVAAGEEAAAAVTAFAGDAVGNRVCLSAGHRQKLLVEQLQQQVVSAVSGEAIGWDLTAVQVLPELLVQGEEGGREGAAAAGARGDAFSTVQGAPVPAAAVGEELVVAGGWNAGTPAASAFVSEELQSFTPYVSGSKACGFALFPTALPLPPFGEAEDAGSISRSSSNDGGMLEVALGVQQGLLQQLLQQGYDALRVVVATHPERDVPLFDGTWPLASTATAAAGHLGRGEAGGAGLAVEAEEVGSNGISGLGAGPEGQEGMRVQLQISMGQLGQEGRRTAQVLSVVILAGNGAPRDTQQEQDEHQFSQASTSGASAAAAVGGAPAHLMLAQMPLLLLPEAVVSEMEAFLAEAVEAWQVHASYAYRQLLLPIVKDLALLVLDGETSSSSSFSSSSAAMLNGDVSGMSSSNSSSGSSSSITSSSRLGGLSYETQQAIAAALAAFFQQHQLEQCHRQLVALLEGSGVKIGDDVAGMGSTADGRCLAWRELQGDAGELLSAAVADTSGSRSSTERAASAPGLAVGGGSSSSSSPTDLKHSKSSSSTAGAAGGSMSGRASTAKQHGVGRATSAMHVGARGIGIGREEPECGVESCGAGFPSTGTGGSLHTVEGETAAAA